MTQPLDDPRQTTPASAEVAPHQTTTDDVGATGPHLDPPLSIGAPPAVTASRQDVLPRLPGYAIEGVLGRGGMGVVYKARHLALKRTVALKMILTGHATEHERGRFRAEAEAVARLQHANIVQIHEVGEYDGHPYCALEFVEGGNLAQKLRGRPLPPGEAARLVEVLAEAMQLAHSRNVIHRDLKPANVLLSAGGKPKVTDFGLARQLDIDSGQTQAGQVMGTPSYMAPEQAAGLAHAAGPAADVYALGAILYECLTGTPPFKGASVLETLEQVRSREPAAPRTLERNVPRDLETVCLKCLRKEPEKRYASAAALGEDLRRWQAGEPILARPVGRAERGVKWAGRNPVVAALLASVVAVAAVGVGAFSVKYVEAQDQAGIANAKRREAEEALEEKGLALEEKARALAKAGVDNRQAHEQLTVNAIIMAQTAWEKGDVIAAQGHLEGVSEEAYRLRNFEWYYLRRQYEGGLFALRGHKGNVNAVAFSPDGRRVVTAGEDKTARLWDARTGAPVLVLKGHTVALYGVAFSPDGRLVATCSGDHTVRLWDADSGALILELVMHASAAFGVTFSPDGKQLATTATDNTARLWDARTGTLALELKGHTASVLGVAFSPDGTRVATASQDRTARLWDARTGALALELKGHTRDVSGVAFSPDGTRLATSSYDNTARLWDARTGTLVLRLQHNYPFVSRVAFSPDGTRLATTGNTATLWDTRSGTLVLEIKGHTDSLYGVAFSPDGTRVATTGADNTTRLWDARTGALALELKGHAGPVSGVAFSPDGTRVATASQDKTARLWDARTGALALELKGHAGPVSGVAFSPDGTRVATASQDKTARLWDARTGQADTVEMAYRTWATRPNPDWHADEADRLGRAGQRFAVAFHLRRLLDLRPGYAILLLRDRPFNAEEDGSPLSLAVYDAAVAREPDSPALRLRRALLRSRLGRHPEARADLEHAAERARDDPVVMLARSLLEARAGRAGESWEKAVREAAEPAMDAKRGWEGRRKTSVPPRDRAGDIADTVLALEEELNGERRALVLQAARTLLAGGNRSGPWSAVMTAAVGVGRPTLSTRQEATAWRVCGLARCARGEWGRATADLDAALSLAPADRAARRVRARAWVELRESDKAITDCTAGLDARPYSWELWYLRALAYRQLNRPALALADLTEALARGGDGPAVRLERMRTEFEVRTNLGNDSTTKGDLAGAIAAYRAAVAIDPKSASAHMNLANALHNKGLFDEAIAAYREVIALDPRHVNGHLNLGRLLSHKGRNEEAIACLRKLVELVPHVGLVHNSLGDALRVRGHFDEALKSYRRCLELGNADEAKLAIQQRLVDETERLIPLAPRLRAFLTGAARPADAAEAIDLARLCCYTKRYAAASRFYAEAFAAQPTLASDLKSGHRYNAACYATQAGCGKGKDDAKPDHQERAKLREQALAWLAADLALRKEQLAGGKPQAPQTVATTMLHWQRDGDLTGIRDSAGLAELPADEKKRCEQLWAQVAALLRKAQKG